MAQSERLAVWKRLQKHHRDLAGRRTSEFFSEDPGRFGRLSWRIGDMLIDLSKNRVTDKTLRLLLELAQAADVAGWRARMAAGEAVNRSEGRAALHVALRDPEDRGIALDGVNISAAVKAVRARIRDFADGVRQGHVTGATGTRFTDVVSIGIGGSDLGPRLVCDALADGGDNGPRLHFVSNIDGRALAATVAALDPAATLFLVMSKTFATQETITNAKSARRWLAHSLGEAAARRHFVAVTANREGALAFGIGSPCIFDIWDWVGGRFSLWSAVGLPIALALGGAGFDALLDGAHAMDRHFLEAPMAENIPVLLALIGIWNGNFEGAAAHAVVPYAERLRLLPAYLSQLEMESNGKSVTRDGDAVATDSAPVVFGQAGTDAQHAFFQALHQGTRLISCDLIAAAEPDHDLDGHHEKLIANFIGQSEALMAGHPDESRPERRVPGGRPCTSILVRRFDAATLGRLLALYEHKVFVQGVIWGINPFDQWGVDLGKRLAGVIFDDVQGNRRSQGHDGSTQGLIDHYRALAGESL